MARSWDSGPPTWRSVSTTSTKSSGTLGELMMQSHFSYLGNWPSNDPGKPCVVPAPADGAAVLPPQKQLTFAEAEKLCRDIVDELRRGNTIKDIMASACGDCTLGGEKDEATDGPHKTSGRQTNHSVPTSFQKLKHRQELRTTS